MLFDVLRYRRKKVYMGFTCKIKLHYYFLYILDKKKITIFCLDPKLSLKQCQKGIFGFLLTKCFGKEK